MGPQYGHFTWNPYKTIVHHIYVPSMVPRISLKGPRVHIMGPYVYPYMVDRSEIDYGTIVRGG